MKNLMEYENWLSAQWVSYEGVACRVLNQTDDELTIETPSGKKEIKRTDSSLRPIEDISLPLFLQIGAPTIAF
jgi:hypothetical protein